MKQGGQLQSLLRRVGCDHKYQYVLFGIFALKWLLVAMLLFSLNFFYYVPDFLCSSQEMHGYDTCEQFVCSSSQESFWYAHIAQPIYPSISLDYGIIMLCSNQWVSSLLQSIGYAGSLGGYLLISYFADNFGRKKLQAISWSLCILGQLLLLSSFNLPMVGIGSFLIGFGANPTITLHYSFLKELVGGKARQRMIIALQIAFSIGLSLISAISIGVHNWKIILGAFILAPSVMILFSYKFVQDTLEFTLKKGIDELAKSLNRISRVNKLDPIELEDVAHTLSTFVASSPSQKLSFLDLFRRRQIMRITLVCGFVNMLIEFIYDGTLLSLTKIGVNVYLNQILVGLVEITAAIFGAYIVTDVKRRQFITLAFLVIAAFAFCLGLETIFFEHSDDVIDFHAIVEMAMLGVIRFCVNSVWGILFVYVAELFPNDISSLSFGWVSVTGTIGASAAPFLRLATANKTFFVIAILSLAIAVIIRSLKETWGANIKDRTERASLGHSEGRM